MSGIAHSINANAAEAPVKTAVEQKASNKLDEETMTQLSYAIEEMRTSINWLDSGSKDYKRILTFAATALERIRPIRLDSESQHYNHYSWVVNSYDYVVNKISKTPSQLK